MDICGNTFEKLFINFSTSNLGLNIAYRLIEKLDPETRITIIVTSRTLPRVKEVVDTIKKYVDKLSRPGIVDFDYLLVDFTNMISVCGAYYELNKRYKEIHYFFANAAQSVYEGIDWIGSVKEIFADPLDAVTNPTYKIQKVGVMSDDNMGLIFQGNVFGPYYLIQKILPQLSRGKAVVVWISSIMSDPKYLSLQDIQLLKSDVPYEGSKRLIDLLHLGTYKDMKKMGIHQYITHPGIFTSQSFFKFLNFFTYYSMIILFYFARYLGSPWHNIDGKKAANAPVYVATLANAHFEKQDLKYGSATYRDGMEYIKIQDINPIGKDDVTSYVEKLKEEWDEKLKNQITNSRALV